MAGEATSWKEASPAENGAKTGTGQPGQIPPGVGGNKQEIMALIGATEWREEPDA